MKMTVPGLAFIILGLVLTYLKINGHIVISWWVALLPLWLPCAVAAVAITVFITVWLLAVVAKLFS